MENIRAPLQSQILGPKQNLKDCKTLTSGFVPPPDAGVVKWKFGEWDVNSDVILILWQRFDIPRSVASSLRVALECDVNKESINTNRPE
ncbi:hypothetical protein TNCV_4197251 [Trichonephila clavipes]|nr:hypothetical protein TNCV_4197251 [Trichonephila clavipes]